MVVKPIVNPCFVTKVNIHKISTTSTPSWFSVVSKTMQYIYTDTKHVFDCLCSILKKSRAEERAFKSFKRMALKEWFTLLYYFFLHLSCVLYIYASSKQQYKTYIYCKQSSSQLLLWAVKPHQLLRPLYIHVVTDPITRCLLFPNLAWDTSLNNQGGEEISKEVFHSSTL